MHNRLLITIILLFSILVTGCQSSKIIDEDVINDANICNLFYPTKIGDISLSTRESSIGARKGNYNNILGFKETGIIYHEDEKIDEKGMLLNGKSYFTIQNKINNTTSKKIEVNLKDFYIVMRGDGGKIIRGSLEPRLAYLETNGSSTVIDNFKLTLKPLEKVSVQIIYIDDTANFYGENCYYRIKYDDKVIYYNVQFYL